MPTLQEMYEKGKRTGVIPFIDLCQNFAILFGDMALFENCVSLLCYIIHDEKDNAKKQNLIAYINKALSLAPIKMVKVFCSICKKNITVEMENKDLVNVCISCIKKGEKNAKTL